MTALATHIILSTAHLEPEVSERLEEMGEDRESRERFGDWRDGLVKTGYAYGYWIKVPWVDETNPDDSFEGRLAHLPRCLAEALRHARQFGCTWILFDRDEEPTPGLKQYDY